MQQGDPGGHAVLDLGHQHHGAAVAAAGGHQHLPLDGHQVLGADQVGGPVGPGGDAHRDAAPVHHHQPGLGVAGLEALDPVAGVAGDGGHGRVEVGQGPQHRPGELVPGGAGVDDGPGQPGLQQRLVGAGDAHRHRLGLVADGVDGAGQLGDAQPQSGGQVLDHRGRGAHLAQLQLVAVQRGAAPGVAQGGGDPHRGRGLEMAVVVAPAQAVGEGGGGPLHRRGDGGHDLFAGGAGPGCGLLQGAVGLAQGPGLGVDGQGRLIAEEVPDHGRGHERELGVDGGHGQHGQGGAVALLAGVGHHDGGRLVGPEDGHLLGRVGGGGAGEAGGAHQHQRLRRQVDVLLVLDGVAGDRLVAEL